VTVCLGNELAHCVSVDMDGHVSESVFKQLGPGMWNGF
jgi:hypothetical protein